MINNKTVLPHTYENQAVLREYGKKISSSLRPSHDVPMPSFWSNISYYFPSMQAAGYVTGEHLTKTYGALMRGNNLSSEPAMANL